MFVVKYTSLSTIVILFISKSIKFNCNVLRGTRCNSCYRAIHRNFLSRVQTIHEDSKGIDQCSCNGNGRNARSIIGRIWSNTISKCAGTSVKNHKIHKEFSIFLMLCYLHSHFECCVYRNWHKNIKVKISKVRLGLIRLLLGFLLFPVFQPNGHELTN